MWTDADEKALEDKFDALLEAALRDAAATQQTLSGSSEPLAVSEVCVNLPAQGRPERSGALQPDDAGTEVSVSLLAVCKADHNAEELTALELQDAKRKAADILDRWQKATNEAIHQQRHHISEKVEKRRQRACVRQQAAHAGA